MSARDRAEAHFPGSTFRDLRDAQSRQRYTVALRDQLTGRYGNAGGYKAGSPVEAVIRFIQGPRRSTTLTVADVEHLGGERYRVGKRIYRVRVSK